MLQAPVVAAAFADAPAGAKVKTRTSKSIVASPLSVGFETLDRKMFDPERTYSHLANLGVKWARCQTGWARTETERGKYDFAWLDGVVDNLLRIGVQPWFNLGYGNKVYTPGPPHESAVGWVPFNSDEARQAWLRYVDRLAARFAGRVKHWEIWNEPNIRNFWQPDTPSAARYVELVKITVPVIRKRVPGVTIIGGAIAGFPALDYLEGCFTAGIANYVDKISYHPYRARPEQNYAAELRAFRAVVDRYKKGMGIWQGENGAPSTSNSTGALRDLPWNEERQARWLTRRILLDLGLGVELTSYFHTVDMVNYVWHTGQSGQTNSKGLLRGTDYTPKPSYFAYQNLCALFDSETRRADFLAYVDAKGKEAAAIECVSFVRKGSPIYAYWTGADLMADTPSVPARLRLWHGSAARLEKPVLVDPLSGAISATGKVTRSGGAITIEGAPLRDYPMLVMDASLVA
jgi:hypothetical protein